MSIEIIGEQIFYAQIAALLGQIKSRNIGDLIYRRITAMGHDLTIEPFDRGKAAVSGDDNAITSRDNTSDASPKGISNRTEKVPLYKGRGINPRTGEDERYATVPDDVVGTGKGSDVHIYFSPKPDDGRPGKAPDEILLHEIVHALRAMQGRHNPVPTEEPLQDYDNEEEYLAIVVTNVYISDKGKSRLRANHHGYMELRPPLDTSAGFLNDLGNRRLMNLYRLIWQPTFWLLSQDKEARFNPFRELAANASFQRVR